MITSTDYEIVYQGECLGCKHLRRLNRFSNTWVCNLEYKPNDNGKSWREFGRKMKKCKQFEDYTENRCVDCALACPSSNSPNYWHCKTDYHCFNYTDKACNHFNGSIENYAKEQKLLKLKEEITSLKKDNEELTKALERNNMLIANKEAEMKTIK